MLFSLAALAAAGCGTTAPPPIQDSALAGARAMVRSRAQLLVEKDTEGYLRPVVGAARPLEEAIAAGAAAVPLSFANVTVTPHGVARDDAVEFRNALVEVVYGYEGLPEDNRFRFSLRYDLQQRGGAWVVTGSRHDSDPRPPAEAAGAAGNRDQGGGTRFERDLPLPFWARFPVQATRSAHFLALHRPELTEAGTVLELAEQARAGLEPRLRFGEPDAMHLVVLARDREEYEAVLGGDRGADSLGVVSLVYIPSAPPEARHMTLNLDRVLERDRRSAGHAAGLTPVSIVQHELAHLALARVGSPFTPSWVEEGAAMHLAGERRLDEWRLGLRDGTFDRISVAGFAEGENLADSDQYAYTNAAVSYLVEEFGTERFWEFYTRFQPAVASVVAAADSAAAFVLASVYDIDLAELDRRTREWMAVQVAAG